MNKKALLEKVLAKIEPKKFKLDSKGVRQHENNRIIDIVEYTPQIRDKNEKYVKVHSPKLKKEIMVPKTDMEPIVESNLNKIKKELTHVAPKNLEKIHKDLKNKSKMKTVVKTILDTKTKKKSKNQDKRYIHTSQDFENELKTKSIYPGGHDKYFLTKDGAALSFETAKEEKELIKKAIENKDDPQWEVIAYDINWEDDDLYCAHSEKKN